MHENKSQGQGNVHLAWEGESNTVTKIKEKNKLLPSGKMACTIGANKNFIVKYRDVKSKTETRIS